MARLALLLLAIGCASLPAAPAPAPAPLRRVPIGLCEDYPEETRSLEEVERDLALAAEAGAPVLRVSIGWDDVEPRDDAFETTFWDQVLARAEARRIRLIPYVAYAPEWAARPGPPGEHWRQPPRDPGEFGEVMEVLARRYRGRIGSWELWNEPDNAEYWRGSVAEYAALLEAGAAGVRRGDPAARIVSGGLAGKVEFLRALFGTHGALRLVDVVNVHAYYETWNPGPLEALTPYLAEVAAAIRLGGGMRPIWLAEVGYGTHRRGAEVSPWVRARYRHEHTPAFQAAALARTVTLALADPLVELIAWYEVKDARPTAEVIGDVNNRHLGIAYPDHRKKPAHAALAFMNRLFRDGATPLPLPPRTDAQVHAFALARGTAAIVAWLPSDHGQDGDGTAIDARRARITIDLPCPAARTAHLHDELGQPRGTVALDGRLPLELEPTGVVVALIPHCRRD